MVPLEGINARETPASVVVHVCRVADNGLPEARELDLLAEDALLAIEECALIEIPVVDEEA